MDAAARGGNAQSWGAARGVTMGIIVRILTPCAGQPGRAENGSFFIRVAPTGVRFRVRRTWNGVRAFRPPPSTTHAKHLGDSRVDESVRLMRGGCEHLARDSCSFCDRLGAGVEGRTWHKCTHERALRARIGDAVEGVVSAPTKRTQACQKVKPKRVRNWCHNRCANPSSGSPEHEAITGEPSTANRTHCARAKRSHCARAKRSHCARAKRSHCARAKRSQRAEKPQPTAWREPKPTRSRSEPNHLLGAEFTTRAERSQRAGSRNEAATPARDLTVRFRIRRSLDRAFGIGQGGLC